MLPVMPGRGKDAPKRFCHTQSSSQMTAGITMLPVMLVRG
jgi:hypothetical protein